MLHRFIPGIRRPLLLAVLLLGVTVLPAPAGAQDVPVTYLYGSGTTAHDGLGWDTAVRGEWLLVGAPRDHHRDPPGTYLSGRVYAFRRDAATGAWAEADLWFPEAIGSEGGGAFGDAIALSPDGRLALVGARGEPGYCPGWFCPSLGAAYVFRYDEGVGAWAREARLRPEGVEEYAYAGQVVAIDEALAVMNGAWNGRSLVVYRDHGGGAWVEEATLHPGPVSGFLSTAGNEIVAVADHPAEGERVVGGAYWEDTAGGPDAGAVYVYRNDGPGGDPAAWALEARLEPGDAAPGRGFGVAVSLSPDGRLLLIGAHAFSVGPGRAYVYRREGDGPESVWVEEAEIPPDVAGATGFGRGVALSAEPGTGKPLALVAHSFASGQGAALFRRELSGSGGFAWEQVTALRDTLIGDTVSLDGATAAGGNSEADTRGEEAGRGLAFDLSGVVATAAEPSEPEPPSRAPVLSASPNPARGAATLALTVPEATHVRLSLCDGLGREVAFVHEGPLGAGRHRLSVDVSGLAAGVYLARAVTAAGVATARLAVAR